jgi:uncharacterized protein involved in exopolysaccharide biosynthesis
MSVMEAKKVSEIQPDDAEIRLVDIMQFLKQSRKDVIKWALGFFIVGIFYAFYLPNEYTATVKVMPELKTASGMSGGLGDLKSLAGLAGVNIGNMNGTSEAIRPDLYPDIIQSVPFSLYLLKQPVVTSNNSKIQNLEDYLDKENEEGLMATISNVFSSDKNKVSIPVKTGSALQLTRRQETLSKMINTRVSADMDKKSGIITITSKMPDAVVAASMAQQTLDYLTTYVTNYRTSKARQQVEFLTNQVNDVRRRYEATELQLSNYRDRNRSLFLETAKIEEQRLQADYILAQGVYSDLSKQLEQARIKVQEESPVFQILEPAQVPLRKSGPKRTIIIVGFGLLGAIIGLVVFFAKRIFGKRI